MYWLSVLERESQNSRSSIRCSEQEAKSNEEAESRESTGNRARL